MSFDVIILSGDTITILYRRYIKPLNKPRKNTQKEKEIVSNGQISIFNFFLQQVGSNCWFNIAMTLKQQ